MDKSLNYLALARKAGRVELGEEPVGAAARAENACLVIVAQDAGDHTWRRAKSFVSGTEQLAIRVPYTKDDLGASIGRTALAMAAFTDPALALAFAEALPEEAACPDVVENLQKRVEHIRKRQQEAKAHRKNVKKGRKT
jgi:ribosomal protein L7Ae-like RNA K-turn-binding protein